MNTTPIFGESAMRSCRHRLATLGSPRFARGPSTLLAVLQ